jgi:aryl-alcohol dehydrogenase-like predicted oxidoreductase
VRTTTLGGAKAGVIGLGCMSMSFAYTTGRRDDREAVAVIHAALEAGANLIDTADVYGPFANECLVGRALATTELAASALVATKVGLLAPTRDGQDPRPDGRPDHLRAAVAASLRRLGLDCLDICFLHRVDPAVPLAESWGALAEAVAAGLVRWIGLSEVTVAQLDLAHRIHPVAVVENELSLFSRGPLADVAPWCAAHGAGLIAYAPLGRGMLTGHYRSRELFGAGDRRARLPRFAAGAFERNLAIVGRLGDIARRHGATPAQVALAWVLAQGDHIVAIPGTKRLAFLAENLAAAGLGLPPSCLLELDSLGEPVGARK